MAIKIVEDNPDVVLTRSEYENLLVQYNALHTGPVKPAFEEWVRGQKQNLKEFLIES